LALNAIPAQELRFDRRAIAENKAGSRRLTWNQFPMCIFALKQEQLADSRVIYPKGDRWGSRHVASRVFFPPDSDIAQIRQADV
jgi:hypothetical protein